MSSNEENVINIEDFEFSARPMKTLHSERDTELLRSELFSMEQLKRHGTILASQYKIDTRPGPDQLLPRLSDNERVLLAVYDLVATTITPGQRIVPAEAWLLDNFYLIEQQISQAKRNLPREFSRQLPRLIEGPSVGFPRVYDLALQLISHMDGRVDKENILQFIGAFQTVEPLKLGELWAFPIMLQLALLENLRRIALRIARRRQEFNEAISWADRMLTAAEREPKQLIQLLAEFASADVPLTASFVEEFYALLQTQESAMAFVITWIEQKLLEQGVTAAQLSEAAGRIAAMNQISIANSISSLRFIGTLDWRDCVETLSILEATLREDPAGLHGSQDFATRDRYRRIVEEIARGSHSHSEPAVAREAITLAQAAAERLGINDRTAHVGYYLIDLGRPILERAVGFRLAWQIRVSRASQHCNLFLYLGLIFLLTAWAASLMLFSIDDLGPQDWRYWFFFDDWHDQRFSTCSFAGKSAGHPRFTTAYIAAAGFFSWHPHSSSHHRSRTDFSKQTTGDRSSSGGSGNSLSR